MDPLVRLKEGQKWMWALGDYTEVAQFLEPCAIRLAELCAISPGAKVLDVAAGNGNFALAAARMGAVVTACDLTPRMVELGRARTEDAGLSIEWLEADAEQLPVGDGRFDVVASVFGAMFAPRPDHVARELFRACAPDGVVAMANYGWAGHLGGVARLLSRYSGPGPAGLPQPFEWGEEQAVRARLADFASRIETISDEVVMRFESVEAGLAFFERSNAPHIALRSMLPADRYSRFMEEAAELMRELNRSIDDRLELGSTYLNVLARP